MLASRAKIPDEPKAASSEVVGFDIIISAGKQAIQVVKGVDGCMRRLPHVYQVCAFWCNSGHATRLCVVHASSEITCWHLQQTRLTLQQVAGSSKECTTWGGGAAYKLMERSSKEMQRWLRKERDSCMCTTQQLASLSCMPPLPCQP